MSKTGWQKVLVSPEMLALASPGCKRCHGTGIMGFLVEKTGRTRLLCPCVRKNGGKAAEQARTEAKDTK
jgi:hypothetical protein